MPITQRYLIRHRGTYYSAQTTGQRNRLGFVGPSGSAFARIRYGRVQRTRTLLRLVPEVVVYDVEALLVHARGCRTVGATYCGVKYEAHLCRCIGCAEPRARVGRDGGPHWVETAWKDDRLVRSASLRSIAPQRVVGRLGERLRRLEELRALGAYLSNRMRPNLHGEPFYEEGGHWETMWMPGPAAALEDAPGWTRPRPRILCRHEIPADDCHNCTPTIPRGPA
jgi:hypothetical protein